MKIRRLPQAIRDVDDIWLYIARHDPDAATRLIERLVSSVARLADYPESGSPRPEIAVGARSITVGNYLVLYRVERDSVNIVRVVHGAQDSLGLLQ